MLHFDTHGVVENEPLYDFGTHDETYSTLPLPDGKVLVVGRSEGIDVRLTRHHPYGQLDTTFGTNGSVRFPVMNHADEGYRASLQPDGKILVSGIASNGSNQDIAVARLSYDGVLDTSFDSDGVLSIPFDGGTNDYGYAVLSMPDGRILVAGRSGDDIALVKLLGDSNQDAISANAAPVNSVPGTQTTQVDTALAFTDFRGSLISISAPEGILQCILHVLESLFQLVDGHQRQIGTDLPKAGHRHPREPVDRVLEGMAEDLSLIHI